jgi:Tfp pilus assembly protein PilE
VRSDVAARPRFGREDGNTLILMPVAILVLVALAAIAVDSAAIYLGQRRVADLAAGLANDAIAAVSEQAFYEQGEIAVQGSRASARQQQVVATLSEDGAFRDVRCDVTPAGDRATASCQARVDPIFGRALRRDGTVVRATETAVAEQR